jgi:hypothetical protein
MSSEFSLDSLVADLKPVRRIKPIEGLALVAGATAIIASIIILRYGLRLDIADGAPQPMVVIRSGMLILLGTATAFAATAAARPAVKPSQNGWGWALAAAALLPLAALILFFYHSLTGMPFQPGAFDFRYAPWCLGLGCGGALFMGSVLTAWLRKGAPTALNRAGWLVGLASGSFGAFAYSLHCPSNSIYYVGIFYTAVVAISAMIGRLIVPAAIRW